MSRVLNRPMFKMGGSTGSGITSGLKRQGYSTGKTVKDALEYYDAMKKAGEDKAKAFCRLMMAGKLKKALKLINNERDATTSSPLRN